MSATEVNGIEWCTAHHGVINEDETECDMCSVGDDDCNPRAVFLHDDGIDWQARAERAEADADRLAAALMTRRATFMMGNGHERIIVPADADADRLLAAHDEAVALR